MFTGTVEFAGLRVTLFHAEGSGHANQDRWFSQPHGSCLRVAAVDGVTPWRAPHSPGGDAAQWAAATILGTLALPLDPETALRHANDLTHHPEVAPSRRQAMAAAAVADCRLDEGRVYWTGVVAADCEIWAADSRESTLSLTLGGDFLTADARHAWTDQLNRLGDSWSLDDQLEHEAALLDDQATQTRHAVGRYREPVFAQASGTAGVVVLASDGASILEATNQGVTIRGLAAWLHGTAMRTSRDDLTCLIVEAVDQSV